jgi:D-sedoheptulose 7-phosphate isomerase
MGEVATDRNDEAADGLPEFTTSRQGGSDAFTEVAARYQRDLIGLIEELDVAVLQRIADRLREARDRGATVFIAGNGGSAATATHWVNDLAKAASRSGRRPMRVLSLTDSASWFTAIANDEGFARVFSAQLENLARQGDVLVLISASGRSPNLISALETAVSRGLVTIALVGFDGGELLGAVDECLLVRTQPHEYGLVETTHVVACDIVTTFLIDDRPAPTP